jgi:crossover junction endodeoxyribonuclease RuvC
MTTSSPQRVLALDLATQTGFALSAAGIITSGSVSFKRFTGSKRVQAEHVGQPMLNFQRWLRTRIQEDKPEAIAYEDVFRWMSSDAAKTFCGLRALLLLNCAYYQIPVFGYSPTHIKKFWSGKGNADKALMIATTVARFPETVNADDNECDAIALLHLHLNQTAEAPLSA